MIDYYDYGIQTVCFRQTQILRTERNPAMFKHIAVIAAAMLVSLTAFAGKPYSVLVFDDLSRPVSADQQDNRTTSLLIEYLKSELVTHSQIALCNADTVEKTMKDFYRGFCGMPLALATYPVFAFLLLGIYGGNILMCLGSIILGVGHIGIHAQHAREVYGKKPKKKLPVRILLGVLKVVGILFLVAVFGFFIIAITGRNANQIKRFVAYRNGVNEQIYVQLDGSEGFINVFGSSESNPVIISLHGGPGSPSAFVDYDWQEYLADNYTIVSWDETGCGRSYYRNSNINPDNSTLSYEQQLADLDALVDYCCDRFGQEQVIILGHSYGSMLGSSYVMAHPEKVSAYIGVGQIVNDIDNYSETYAYEDALCIAKEKGDDTSEMLYLYLTCHH